MLNSTKTFISLLNKIVSTPHEAQAMHDQIRHLARSTLAVIEHGHGITFIWQEGLSSEDYSYVKYWLVCMEANGMTYGDRVTAAQYIIDIYNKDNRKTPVPAIAVSSKPL